MSIPKVKSILVSPKSLALLGQAVASGGNFALGVLLARWLGLAVFGQYSLLWMGVLFLLSLHQAYITQPFLTLIAGKESYRRATYLESLSGLQLLISISLVFMALAFYSLMKIIGYKVDLLQQIPAIGFVSAFYLIQDFVKKYCFANGQFNIPLLMDVILYISLFSCLILFKIDGSLDLDIALWSIMVSYGISCGIGVRLIGHQLIKRWNRKQILKTAKEHYHYSFWLLGTSLVQWFSGNYFLVAAAATQGTVAVGALRMAQNMVGLCHVIFLAMENIVPVEAARQFFTKGEKAMFAYLRRAGGLVAIPVVGLLGILTLVSHWLIGWLYGTDYQAFAYLVGAYAVVYLLGYIATLQRFALRSMQFTKPIFIGYTASALVSLLVAYPVVERWGMGGVVAGLIGAQVLTLVVYGFAIFKKTDTSQIFHLSNSQS
ncbi:MAG: hypothetical protein GC192_06795 [Bacteroidetes bacterium]|nr:hypothetical protein [Bacteroidota bacterium]